MDNQDEKALNTGATDTSVEAGATSEETHVEADQPTQEATSQGESTQGQPETENIKNSAEVKHETRRDRRIGQLIGKLKEKDKPQAVMPDINELLGLPPTDQTISEQDLDEYGNVPPKVFNEKLRQTLMSERQSIKRELAQEQQFKDTVRDHLSDAERTLELLKDDDVLDEVVAEQYELINHTIDPYTGQKVFIPRVKMSEIYAREQKLLQSKIASAQADVSARLQNQASESAVAPSAKGEPSTDYQDQAVFEDAKASGGDTEKWAQVLKRRLFKS